MRFTKTHQIIDAYDVLLDRPGVYGPSKILVQDALAELRTAELAESAPSTSINSASPKSAPDIVESNNWCDYCTKPVDCMACCVQGYKYFVGRRLRAG
jgi:hypothetical protein